MKAALIEHAEINGRKVGFFTPPHDEPDMPWVDALAVIRAYLPKRTAIGFFKAIHVFRNPGFARARDGDRIVNIISHPVAQGLTQALDEIMGDPSGDGPAFNAYCRAAVRPGLALLKRYPSDQFLDRMVAAYHNAGGPILRKAEAADDQ